MNDTDLLAKIRRELDYSGDAATFTSDEVWGLLDQLEQARAELAAARFETETSRTKALNVIANAVYDTYGFMRLSTRYRIAEIALAGLISIQEQTDGH